MFLFPPQFFSSLLNLNHQTTKPGRAGLVVSHRCATTGTKGRTHRHAAALLTKRAHGCAQPTRKLTLWHPAPRQQPAASSRCWRTPCFRRATFSVPACSWPLFGGCCKANGTEGLVSHRVCELRQHRTRQGAQQPTPRCRRATPPPRCLADTRVCCQHPMRTIPRLRAVEKFFPSQHAIASVFTRTYLARARRVSPGL